jgi:predicted transcriptional regulator
MKSLGPIHPIVENIPAELRTLNQWVAYKAVPKGNGKVDKLPVNPRTGVLAEVDDPSTWATIEEALIATETYHLPGIGFVFSEQDPFCGIDLDSCRNQENGTIEPQAEKYLSLFKSYSEITPSEEGFHIIVKGKLPPGGNRKGKIEVYDKGRFFTFTGNVVNGCKAIAERQAELEAFHQEIFGVQKKNDDRSSHVPVEPLDLDDEELLDRARKAENGAKFSRLFDNGDIAGYDSPSEADLALCGMFAFWFGRDKEQMDRVFRRSGLYRDKWDRADYRNGTMDKAIADCREVYKPPKCRPTKGECPPIEWEPEYLEHSEKTPEHTKEKDVVCLWSCRDVLDRKFEDSKPIIEDLLGEKESLEIIGPSGLGKSLFALNMALRLGANEEADSPIRIFDQFGISRTCKSLFIQSENTAAATQKRIGRILEFAEWLEPGLDRVFFASIRDDIRLAGPLTDPKFQGGILSLLDRTQADILFLDPLISYHDADENDNAAMRRTLDCLTSICDKANVACIIVHHAGKAGTDNQVFAGRGASAIGDWASNILVLSPGPEIRKEDGSRRFVLGVSHRKSRNFETVENFYLERVNGALLVPIHPEQLDQKRIKRIQAIVEVLTAHEGFIDHKEVLISEIMKKSNVSRGTAQTSIKAALEDNKIFIVPINRKQSGYRLPDVQPDIEVNDDC